MPILDMIFSTPLPRPLIRFCTAWASVTPGRWPLRTSSSQLSIARYGFTAEAPNPMSTATWWTSRTSPASTSSEILVRLALLSRWWCTALVSSSVGIGAHCAFESRSESTMNFTPRLTAPETFSQISCSLAASSEAPPSGR